MRNFKLPLMALALLSFSACGSTIEEAPTSETPMQTQSPVESETPIIEAEFATVLDRLAIQNEMDEDIIREMSGLYTADSPLVLLDPYGVAPLTALVVFDTEKNCSVSIEIKGKTEETTFSHDFGKISTHHEIPVYGLYADSENDVILTLTYEDNSTETVSIAIETEALPDYIAPYELLVSKAEIAGGENGDLLFMAAATDTFHPFAIDKEGDVRWYSSTNTFSGGLLRRLPNGNLISLSDPMYAPAFIRPGFLETDFMGRVYKEYLVDYTHHDVVVLPNENYLVSTIKPDSTIQIGPIVVGSDAVLEIDSKTGETLRTWDLNEICGYTAADVAEGRYLHTNSVFYDENDNSIIFSSPNPMLVVKFDAETSEIIWAIGNPLNPYPEAVKSKILSPTETDFLWNGSQHAATVLPDGNILMFDNGTGRLSPEGLPYSDEDSFSRLVIFDIDEENMTISTVYEYGEERGNDMYSSYLGDVDHLGENHYLINSGGRIIDPITGIAKGTSFDVFMGISRGESSIVEIKDGEVVFEIYVGEDVERSFNNIYRTEWLSVYDQNESEYDIASEKGERFGQLLPSEIADFSLATDTEVKKLENDVYFQAKDYGYQLNVPLFVEGTEQGDQIFLELKSEENTFYYMTVGLDGAEGVVRKNGLPDGNYALGLVLQKADGTIYHYQSEYTWNIN